jgi:agmatinase
MTFRSDRVSDACEISNTPVYFSWSRVLDPSVFCGTGTPEAGGVSFRTAGGDLCLQAPRRGVRRRGALAALRPGGVSTAAACKLTREILLQMKGA